MGKINAKGRSRESRHVRIYSYMWPALLDRLNGNCFKALFYMLTFEDGSNNGLIYMGARGLAEGINVDKKTALKCLHRLDQHGFIRPEQLGYFQQKGGPATRWRFTFLPANGKPPSNEWRHNPAEQKSWGEIIPDAGGKITPKPSVRRAAGVKNGPVVAETDQSAGVKKGTHTVAIGSPILGTHFSDDFSPENMGGSIAAGEAA
jgi:hypothetical protein